VVKAVKGLFSGGGALVQGIDFDNEAERKVARGVYLFCLGAGAYWILKGIAAIISSVT
jgi:hypothetical protein